MFSVTVLTLMEMCLDFVDNFEILEIRAVRTDNRVGRSSGFSVMILINKTKLVVMQRVCGTSNYQCSY